MKSMLIIGMGNFGHHLCENLIELGNDVMIVDWDEDKVSDMIYKVTNVQIGDCTDPDVVKSIGVGNFDLVFVCIGTNFQSSLEITDLVKSMGAKYVISKATRSVHAKFLLKNGADEVIYPERDIAERYARKCSADNVFDYIELDNDYSISEMSPPKSWIGKSIKDLDIRNKYKVSIVGIKEGTEMNILPEPTYEFKETDHIMVLAADSDLQKII